MRFASTSGAESVETDPGSSATFEKLECLSDIGDVDQRAPSVNLWRIVRRQGHRLVLSQQPGAQDIVGHPRD
jgi:hypothetical protein